MLIEAGLLAGEIQRGAGGPRTAWPVDGREFPAADCTRCMFPLTWDGHDFLAAARDQKIWNKAIGTAGGMTLEIIKQYLQSLLKSSIGLP